MGRVSQAQALENRRHVVETAARLFRERGVQGVSVTDLMAEAGLTHGGFYKQFASKDALVGEAVAEAFGAVDADPAGFVDRYLSPAHRDDPGGGCPAAGFGTDVAHEPPDSTAREAYAKGIAGYADLFDGDLAAVSMLVGAIILARATVGTELSDQILTAARDALPGPAEPKSSGRIEA